MDAEELASRLGMLCQLLRFDLESPRRVGLLHGDIDAANPGIVHANVRYDVSAIVGHRDIHGLAKFLRLLLRRAVDSAGILHFYHVPVDIHFVLNPSPSNYSYPMPH